MDALIEFIILVVVLWQISATLKKVFGPSSKDEKGDKARPAGWQRKLREVAEKIKEEIEAQNVRANMPPGKEWEKVLPEKRQDRKSPMEAQKFQAPPPLPRKQKKTMASGRLEPAAHFKKSAPLDRPEETPTEDVNAVCPPMMQKRKKTTSLRRYRGLKKAIVWKEVLDAPLGLREDYHSVSRSKSE